MRGESAQPQSPLIAASAEQSSGEALGITGGTVQPSPAHGQLHGTVPAARHEATAALEPASTHDYRWDLAFAGIIGYLAIDYMRLPAMFDWAGPLRLAKFAVALALIGYFVSPNRHTGTADTRAIDTLLTLLLLCAGLSVIFASYFDLALDRLVDVARYVIIYFLISRVVWGKWRIRVFVLVWLLLNFKIGQFVIRSYLIERSLPWQTSLNIATQGVGAGSTGFFSNASDLGVAMCVVWPVAVYLVIAHTTKFTRVVAAATALASLGAILVCGSRGAIVGAAAIVVLNTLRNPKRIVALLMVILFAVGVYTYLPEGSRKRWDSAQEYENDQTSYHRILLWKAGIAMFLDHPLFGVGIGNYPIVRWESYPIPNRRMGSFKSVAHSTYIEAISEMGGAGALVVLLIWLSFFRLNAKTRAVLLRSDPKSMRSFEFSLATALDLSLVGFLGSAAFVSVLWYPHIFILLATSVSLHGTVVQDAQSRSSTLQEPDAFGVTTAS